MNIKVTAPHSFNSKIYIITLILAFCSILYEFLLAQTLSTILGDTLLRYNLTIGLYVASMGLGALYFSLKCTEERIIELLVKTEIALCFTGLISPVLILLIEYNLKKMSAAGIIDYWANSGQFLLHLTTHSFIVAIGFLTGLELPMLLKLAELKKVSVNRTLGLDYFGTLLGALFFPLFLVQRFDIFTMAIIISFINFLVANYLIIRFLNKKKYLKLIFFLGGAVSYIVILLYSFEIKTYLINEFYLYGL